MKTNNKKTNALRLSALLLLSGTALAAIGCNSNAKLFFTVKGKDLEVTFCDRAASIYSIKYGDTVVTYHPKDYNTFLTSGYCYGRTLGRITGRIPDGKITVDGKEYQLELNEVNETTSKNNSIHGGKNGLPSKDFKHYIHETDEAVKVSFNYVSPHLEAGYPETVNTWVSYTIYKNESKIDTNITATSTGKTPVNITTHPFFRLANEGDIRNCELTIPADQMAEFEVNETTKKTNQVVKGLTNVTEEFDFKSGMKIGEKIDQVRAKDDGCGGYDHIWKFNNGEQFINLYNPDSKINLHVTTDADAIIMYANCFPHENDVMNPSGKDSLFAGISVEPYKFFTRDQSSIDQLMIEPGKPFTRNISYQFSTK